MRVVFSLGSNLGDRLAHLQGGVDVIGRYLAVRAVSPVYETVPVGGPEQGLYLNAVVVAEGEAAPLDVVAAAEAAAGRVRDVRWGPRTLDVDVVCVDRVVSDDPTLTLPHPRAHERAFVLRPWLDVDRGAVLPGRGPVRALADRLGDSGVRRRDDLTLRSPA